MATTTEHYQALLDRVPMIDEALCWTVVRGIGRPITMEEVIERIGGDPATLEERDWDAAHDHFPAGVVHLAQAGSAVTLFEVNGREGQRPEVLRWLTDGACAHSVYWHVNGGDLLAYAAYGKLITGVDVFSPEHRHGDDPAALDDDLQELIALRADDASDYRPAAMAVVEARTGVRLQPDWFERPRLSVIIAEPLPSDPYAPTGLASVDPDLHVLLSLADADTQRTALTRVTRLLAERFDLADPATASRRALLELRGRLREEFEASREQGPMEQNPAWLRMQATLAISTAALPAESLNALCHASLALGADWPALRNELRALARAATGNSAG